MQLRLLKDHQKEGAVIQTEINTGTGSVVQRCEANGSGLIQVTVDGNPCEAGITQIINYVGCPSEILRRQFPLHIRTSGN